MMFRSGRRSKLNDVDLRSCLVFHSGQVHVAAAPDRGFILRADIDRDQKQAVEKKCAREFQEIYLFAISRRYSRSIRRR